MGIDKVYLNIFQENIVFFNYLKFYTDIYFKEKNIKQLTQKLKEEEKRKHYFFFIGFFIGIFLCIIFLYLK